MSILVPLVCLIAGTAVVSLRLAVFIRSRLLAIGGSLVITELVCLLYLYNGIASSPDAPEVIGMPGLLAVAISPIIVLTSFACVAATARFRRSRRSV